MDGFLQEKMEKKVMLHQGNKALNILLLVFMLACNSNESHSYYDKSKNIVGINEYNSVLSNAKDSINKWKENNLKSYVLYSKYQSNLDTLLCFNNKKDKCVMALGYQLLDNDNHDGLVYFYGVKIKSKWYFFDGAAIHLPRENYQKDIHTPLSFEKLHKLAMKHVFAGYLKHNNWFSQLFLGKEAYEINEGFFSEIPNRNLSGEGFGSCLKCKTEDEYYLYLVNKNWQKRDTTFNKKENS